MLDAVTGVVAVVTIVEVPPAVVTKSGCPNTSEACPRTLDNAPSREDLRVNRRYVQEIGVHGKNQHPVVVGQESDVIVVGHKQSIVRERHSSRGPQDGIGCAGVLGVEIGLSITARAAWPVRKSLRSTALTSCGSSQ